MFYTIFKKIQGILAAASIIGILAVPIFTTPVSAVDVLGSGSGCNSNAAVPNCGACNNPDATNKPSFCPKPGAKTTNPIIGPDGIITRVILILSYVVGILSIVMILISGFRFITSSGNPEAVAGARNTLIYSLVGIGVAALGVVIVEFVLGKV